MEVLQISVQRSRKAQGEKRIVEKKDEPKISRV